MYLDKATKDTGALRVIPGSHRHGSPDLFEVLRPRIDEPDFRPFGLAPTEVPCWPLETEPGDVLVFTESLLHGSFGGPPGRHQLSVSFVANPTTDDQEKQMLAFYAKTKYSFRPSTSYINSDRPRIRRMVSKLVEWGFEHTEV
jgi:ectoine hydroxylase-related dioxygenase (phytanoyl-CoA dioxygenase family)